MGGAGGGIGPNVYPFDSLDWPRPLEFMAEAAISVAVGRQSAIAEAHGLYRMIQPESSVEELRELIAVSPPHIERVLRAKAHVEDAHWIEACLKFRKTVAEEFERLLCAGACPA